MTDQAYNPEEDDDDIDNFPEILAIGDIIDNIKDYVVDNSLRAKITISVDLSSKEKNSLKESYTIFAVPAIPIGEEYDKHFKALNKIVADAMKECFPEDTVQDVEVAVDPAKLISGDPDIEMKEVDKVIEDMAANVKKAIPPSKKPTKDTGNMSFKKIMEMDSNGD